MPTRQHGGSAPAPTQHIAAPCPAQISIAGTVDEFAMYPKEVTSTGATRHSRHCRALFNRRDWHCHRCCELEIGAAPRGGWQHDYFSKRLGLQQRSFTW